VPAMMTEALQRLMPGSHMHLREGAPVAAIDLHKAGLLQGPCPGASCSFSSSTGAGSSALVLDWVRIKQTRAQ